MIAVAAGALTGLILDVPVDPDGDQARQWLIDELSKPEYLAAKPTLWDQISQAFWDWLNSLHAPGGVLQGPLLLLVVLLVAAAIVAAFFIFGRPRRNRRGAGTGALFGEDEKRTAEELRRSAGAAAAKADWALAIEELFRSIARRMTERVIVSTSPGTTARGFALRAAEAFPTYASRLLDSAASFDSVRYLGESGSEVQYIELVALEAELREARPAGIAAVVR
ncbi:MAG TPA: DUF4129 domain-containing protein [Terrimesophilobacter sp.]|nr:DUF4129 domain-containing protein [Terrimesophilobacter sp.]